MEQGWAPTEDRHSQINGPSQGLSKALAGREANSRQIGREKEGWTRRQTIGQMDRKIR